MSKKKKAPAKPAKASPRKNVPLKSETSGPRCDVCGEVTFENHCRYVCPKCGATRDCSDP